MYSEFCHKSTTKARWTCRNPQLVKYISTLSAFMKLQPFGPAERQHTLLLTFFPLSRRILIANNKYCRTVFSLRTVTYDSFEFQFSTSDLKSNSPRSEATFNLQYCGPFSVRILFSSQSALGHSAFLLCSSCWKAMQTYVYLMNESCTNMASLHTFGLS